MKPVILTTLLVAGASTTLVAARRIPSKDRTADLFLTGGPTVGPSHTRTSTELFVLQTLSPDVGFWESDILRKRDGAVDKEERALARRGENMVAPSPLPPPPSVNERGEDMVAPSPLPPPPSLNERGEEMIAPSPLPPPPMNNRRGEQMVAPSPLPPPPHNKRAISQHGKDVPSSSNIPAEELLDPPQQ